MKKRQFFLLFIFLLLIIYLFWIRYGFSQNLTLNPQFNNTQPSVYPTSVLPSRLEGPFPVIKVLDGDTVDVEINSSIQTIRFVGIDTPEVSGPYRSAMWFGKEASGKTMELLEGQQVYLEIDSQLNLIDKYQRLLRYVYRASDNLFVSKYLVETGYATEYSYQGVAHKYQAEFRQAQSVARDNGLGLWNNKICPIPPNPHF